LFGEVGYGTVHAILERFRLGKFPVEGELPAFDQPDEGFADRNPHVLEILLVPDIVSGILLLRDSIRDTANKRSLELCATIVHVFLGGWSVWCVSVLFVAVQVLGNWKY
jgi:hypothetical protein